MGFVDNVHDVVDGSQQLGSSMLNSRQKLTVVTSLDDFASLVTLSGDQLTYRSRSNVFHVSVCAIVDFGSISPYDNLCG